MDDDGNVAEKKLPEISRREESQMIIEKQIIHVIKETETSGINCEESVYISCVCA